MINVLAEGHNAVTPVRLEPAAPRSRVKHSTTEPLRSQNLDSNCRILQNDVPITRNNDTSKQKSLPDEQRVCALGWLYKINP